MSLQTHIIGEETKQYPTENRDLQNFEQIQVMHNTFSKISIKLIQIFFYRLCLQSVIWFTRKNFQCRPQVNWFLGLGIPFLCANLFDFNYNKLYCVITQAHINVEQAF